MIWKFAGLWHDSLFKKPFSSVHTNEVKSNFVSYRSLKKCIFTMCVALANVLWPNGSSGTRTNRPAD